MRKTLIGALLCSAAAIGVSAGTGTANGTPDAHDHYLKVNGRLVQVGPPVCEHPEVHDAFHNFHTHVHRGAPNNQGGLTFNIDFCDD